MYPLIAYIAAYVMLILFLTTTSIFGFLKFSGVPLDRKIQNSFYISTGVSIVGFMLSLATTPDGVAALGGKSFFIDILNLF